LLVAILAVAAAVFGMFPNGIDLGVYSSPSWMHVHAGGWSLVVWALAQVLAARWVRARAQPDRSTGVGWLVAIIMIDVSCGAAWLLENFRLDPWVLKWPAHVTAACVGAASVLVFVALPIVLVVSDGSTPPALPKARAVAP
jgi:hypothetical protein